MAERNARQAAPQPQQAREGIFNWPTDPVSGEPMVLVTMGCSELVGLPNYSSILIGPVQATAFVSPNSPVTDEMYAAMCEGLRKCIAATEEILGEERQALLDLVSGKQKVVVSNGAADDKQPAPTE